MSKLEDVQKEYDEVMEKLASPDKSTDWETLGEKKKELEEIVERKKIFEDLKKRIAENKRIIEEESDEDITGIAKEELPQLEKEKEELIKEIKRMIGEKESGDDEEVNIKGAAIVEIRAGTGGEEASLFAANLFHMYSRFAQAKGFEVKILDENKTEHGGYKIVTFKIKGDNPYQLMRYEAGVHRVQRVPHTEKAGRVHTSTASVAVLPEPKKGKVVINPQDLRTETYKASGPGGQYVNKRETAIRITHNPTGTVVTSQTERSLQQNKENALSILQAKILEKKQEEKRKEREKERKTQIGDASRSEKIRTYNFAQNRVTDHRIEKNWYRLEEIMEGDLEEVVETIREEEEKEKYKDIVIE